MSMTRALLVGINKYPNLDPRHELAGCVSDARLMKSVLTSRFGFVETDFIELYDEQATRENILNAMQKLLNEANKDDCIYFHFAGHGSQRTCLDQSESSGLDSTIVPSDSSREPYPNLDIIDDEIGLWLEQLSSKTRNITLVFDCCHSGTITRDASSAKTRALPPDLRTIEQMGLTPSARSISREPSSRNFLPRSDAYVVLSGCRDDEKANEYSIQKDGTLIRHGALSYWLSQILLSARQGATYQDVFEAASQQISALFPTQHPQIEGRRDRVLFGTEIIEALKYFVVTSVTQDRVVFAGGAAHGVAQNSQWAVYPAGTNQTTGITPLAKLTVNVVEAMTSSARATEITGEIDKGCRCVLLSTPVNIPTQAIDIALLPEHVKTLFLPMLDGSELLSIALSADTADMKLSEKEGLWTAISKDEYPLVPLQTMQGNDDLTRMLNNLETRARAINVFNLYNPHSDIQIEFNVYRSTDGEHWDKTDENTVFNHGDRAAFEIINKDSRDLFVSVLDIGLTGKISLFYPPGLNSEKLARGTTIKFAFTDANMSLGVPSEYTYDLGRETFKLMVSTDQTSFSWLQQSGTRALAGNSPFQQLMQQMMQGSKTRDPIINFAGPSDDWQAINRSFELRKLGSI